MVAADARVPAHVMVSDPSVAGYVGQSGMADGSRFNGWG